MSKRPEKGASAKPENSKDEKSKNHEGVWTLYKIEGDKVVRQRPTCERCGPGYFMADHHDRFTCGHCGFTRYKRA
jgi:small subunit ribosomal protein S27Ae